MDKRSLVLWEWGLVSGSSCIIHKGTRGKDKKMKSVCACARVFRGSVGRVLKYRIIWILLLRTGGRGRARPAGKLYFRKLFLSPDESSTCLP